MMAENISTSRYRITSMANWLGTVREESGKPSKSKKEKRKEEEESSSSSSEEEERKKESWALLVFLNFFTNKKLFLAFFIKLI